MTKKEEVTSKVYKAVKKDGKCVLVKKQRPKPKKAKVEAKPKQPVQPVRQPVQRTLTLPSQEQVLATQQKEAAIRAASRPAPKPKETTDESLKAEVAKLRQTILGLTPKMEKVPESVAKSEQVKPQEPQEGVPIQEALERLEKQPVVSYNKRLDKVPKNLLLSVYEKIGPIILADAKKENKAVLRDVLIGVYFPQMIDDIENMSLREIKGYLIDLEPEDSPVLRGGANGKIDGGLYDNEISDMMKNVKTFQGVIAADEIDTLKARPVMSFIMNKDDRGEPGSHWVAVYIDTMMGKEVCYYDPLGNPPEEDTRRALKELVDEINPKHMCKFKINTMKNQKSDTDTCGFMCIRFLKDMIGGKSFKDATGYSATKKDNSDVMEDKAEKLANKFGYI